MMSTSTPNHSQKRDARNNPAQPFGYSFPEIPYECAPTPPTGPPILDENEYNMLDSFLSSINTNPFPDEFWLPDSQNDTNNPLGFSGFDWPADLPPTFQGSATSLPSHPPSFPHHSSEKPLGIAPEQSNHEVMAAASMLYQNGLNGPDFNTNPTNPPLFSNIDYSQPKGHGKERQQNGHLPRRTSAPSRSHPPVAHHTTMFMNVHQPISAEQQLSAKAQPLHWGSDSSFMDRGYVAPPDQPDEEQRTQELMENLECLEPQDSNANTRAPTPDRRIDHHSIPWADTGIANYSNGQRKDYGDSIEDISHPKKKQRLSIKEEDDEASDEESMRQRSKRSKGSGRRLSNDAIRKSRASQSSKTPRENLTEEQKRSNHIHSEQKRRNLIKQGFDDLCTLVPGLKGGGFSKSAVLTQAADWLEEIIRSNENLRMQLTDLKAMNGYMMPH